MSEAGPDAGLEAVQFVREALSVDAEWARSIERGFQWWPGPHAQRVWVEPGFIEEGVRVWRLHARTELVLGFRPATPQWQVLAALAAGASLCAPLREGDDNERLVLASSAYVHEGAAEMIARHFSFSTAMQVNQAHAMTEKIAPLLGAEPWRSEHPYAGPRGALDGMLGLIEHVVRPQGAHDPAWSADDARGAFEEELGPLGVRAESDGQSAWCGFDVAGGEATLLINPAAKHPAFGHGALVRLALPPRALGPVTMERALELNARELRERTRAALLGSWYPEGERLVHDVFLPNACALEGLLGLMLVNALMRLAWVRSLA